MCGIHKFAFTWLRVVNGCQGLHPASVELHVELNVTLVVNQSSYDHSKSSSHRSSKEVSQGAVAVQAA